MKAQFARKSVSADGATCMLYVYSLVCWHQKSYLSAESKCSTSKLLMVVSQCHMEENRKLTSSGEIKACWTHNSISL